MPSLESRILANKILVYADTENLKVLKGILGEKPYSKEFYGKIGVDIYKYEFLRKIGKKKVLQSVYFWVLNPSDMFDFIRQRYDVGADGLIIALDYNSPESIKVAIKSLLETLKTGGLRIPIVVLIRVPDELYDDLVKAVNRKLFEAEMNLLVEHQLLVGFYVYSNKKRKNVKKAVKNLIGIICQQMKTTS